jgi:hypothetical protein
MSVTDRGQSRFRREIEIGRKRLIITPDSVQFGDRTVSTASIDGIRFGIFKQTTNGIRTERSYSVGLREGQKQLDIECVTFMTPDAVVADRYRQVIDALEPVIISRLLDDMFMRLMQTPGGFEVGGIRFDQGGLHRSGYGELRSGVAQVWHGLFGGQSPEERRRRYEHLPWASFGGHDFPPNSGNVCLRRADKSPWASLALRTVWNAVCLPPLLNALSQRGLIEQLARSRPL